MKPKSGKKQMTSFRCVCQGWGMWEQGTAKGGEGSTQKRTLLTFKDDWALERVRGISYVSSYLI